MKPWLWIVIALTFFFLGGYVFKKSTPSAPQTPNPAALTPPAGQEGAAMPRSDSGQNIPVPRQNSPGSENSQPQFQNPESFGADAFGEEGFIDNPEEGADNFAPQPGFASPPPAPPPPSPDFAPEPFFDGGGDVPLPFEPPPPLEDDEGGFIPPPVPFDNPEEADPISLKGDFQVGF